MSRKIILRATALLSLLALAACDVPLIPGV